MNFDELLKQAEERDKQKKSTPKVTLGSIGNKKVTPIPIPSISKAGEERAESALLRAQKTPQTLAEEKATARVLPRAVASGVAQAPLNIARAVPAIAAATLADGGISKRYEEANKYALKPVSAEQMSQAQRIAAFVPKMNYGAIGLGGIDEFISGTQQDIQALQTPGNRILAQAAMAAGQMAPVIATGGIAGAGAGYGVLGAQAYGQSFGEAIERGADVKTAGQYAALSSALELSTEGLVGGIPGLGKGVLSKMIKTPSAVNLASKVGVKTAGTFLGKTASAVGKALSSKGGRLLVNALGEGSEEVIASALAPSIERSTIDPNATDATLAELAESFAVGGLLSAVLGVPSITLSTGKTITKLDDIDTLTPSETKEVESELYRLARESNIRRRKLKHPLYTGSSNPNIESFIAGGDGVTKRSGDSFGKGVYLTDNPEVAKLYAQGDSGTVYQVGTKSNLLDLDSNADKRFVDVVIGLVNDGDQQYKNRLYRTIGRTRKAFDSVEDARNFFDEQDKIWGSVDSVYSGNKPEALKENNKFVVEYTDYNAEPLELLLKAKNKDIFESLSSINTNTASNAVMASGFDGIKYADAGAFNAGIQGKTSVVFRNEKDINILKKYGTTDEIPKGRTIVPKPKKSVEVPQRMVQTQQTLTPQPTFEPLNRPVQARTPQNRTVVPDVAQTGVKQAKNVAPVRRALKQSEVDFPDLPVKKTNIKNEARTFEPFEYNKYGDDIAKLQSTRDNYTSYKVKSDSGEYIVQLEKYKAGGYGDRVQVRIAEPKFWKNGSVGESSFSNADEAMEYVNLFLDNADGKISIDEFAKSYENIGRQVPPQIADKASNRPVQQRTVEKGTLPQRKDIVKPVDDFITAEQITKDAVTTQNIKDAPTVREKLNDVISLAQRKLVDSGETVSKIARITGDTKLYNYYNNARLARRRATNQITENQTNINGETVGKSLKDIFDPIMKKGDEYYSDFQRYMFALHNIDRMAQEKPVFGVSAQASAKIADDLLSKHPEFEGFRNEVRNYLDNLIQYRIDSGLWSQEQADMLRERYPNYVPTYRTGIEGLIQNAYRGGLSVKKGLKAAKGSEKDLLPLHEQLAEQTVGTVEAATKNLFALQLFKNLNEETSLYMREITNIDEDVKTAFSFYQKGEPAKLAVNKGLLEAIEAFKGKNKSELEIAAEKANSKFKELITGWNPFFLVRNFARDIQDTGLYSKDLGKFAKAYPEAIKEIVSNGKLWQQYKALGGAGNSFFDYAKNPKEPNWLKRNTINRVETLNESVEQLPRLTEFIATLSKVENPTYDDLMQAMYNAADVTVNFGRSGAWGKTLNSTFVPFFNPAIQGTSKLIRKFQETKGVEQWTLLVLKAAMLGVAPSLLNAMVYDDDEDYKLLDNRVKDTNFLFKIGDDEFIKIPKGRVLSLFGATAQRTLRAAEGEENAFAGLLTTAKEQVAPISPFESNIVSPILKTMQNKTWYGGTIEPERLQNLRPSERYTEKTTSLSKAIISKVDKIADAINLSPMKLDVLIDSYSGIIGDIAIPLLTPRAEQNILKRSFVVDSATQNRISDDFYTAKQELTYKRNSNDGTMADDVANSYINIVTQKVYDNFAEIRKIENGIWTDKEKRERTRKYYKIINGLELEALSNLKKVTQTATKLSKTIKDYEELKRETNKEVFGAEHALSAYDPKVYQKAEGLNKSGIKYDTFYDVYFSVKDIKADKDANGNSIAYTSSKKKKQAIDKLMKNYTEAQRRAVYKAFDISEKVW